MTETPPVSCPTPCEEHPQVEMARAHLLTLDTAVAVAELFRALGDTTRARIVACLLHQDLCTCDLAVLMGVTDSAISQHLRVLRAAHIVQSRRKGKLVFHGVDQAHIALLLQIGLGHVQGGDVSHLMIEQSSPNLTKGVFA